jgi:Protein of unknown function (DUF3341)
MSTTTTSTESTTHASHARRPYGLLAEFEEHDTLIEAAEKTYAKGYRKLDAFSPFPVEGLAEAIGFRRNRMPLIVLIGGILGGIGAFAMMWFSAVINYPINVGGKPLLSWPAFVPITFELTVLAASLSAVFGMLGLNGLPMPHHPLFYVPEFNRASQDRFFLLIQSDDPLYDPEGSRTFLEGLGPGRVIEVPSDPDVPAEVVAGENHAGRD